MTDLLQVQQLRLSYGPTEVVKGVDLTVPPGPYGLGVIGESGSGKTTIARALVRLHPVGLGSITFGGDDVTTLAGARLVSYRRAVQLVFQDGDGALDPQMSAFASVSEPLAIHGTVKRRDRREHVAALLDEVGLPPSVVDRYRTSSQADNGSASSSPEPWPSSRNSWCSTSRPPRSTSRSKSGCGAVMERGRTRDLLETPVHPYTQALRAAVPELGVSRQPVPARAGDLPRDSSTAQAGRGP